MKKQKAVSKKKNVKNKKQKAKSKIWIVFGCKKNLSRNDKNSISKR